MHANLTDLSTEVFAAWLQEWTPTPESYLYILNTTLIVLVAQSQFSVEHLVVVVNPLP